MKKSLLVLMLSSFLIIGISTNAACMNTDERGYISVNATSMQEIASDTVEISITIETDDTKSLQNATLENKQISDKVYTELKSMINPENGDFVKTANFTAAPKYVYINNKKVFDKYQVSNSIVVKTKNIKDVGVMIDKALSLGATNISNLVFSISNYDKQCDDLIANATQKARGQADIIANSASTAITGIKTINANCSMNGATRRIQYNLLSAKAAVASGDMAESTPIENDTIKIYANVSASFYVK